MCQANDSEKGEASSPSALQSDVGAEAFEDWRARAKKLNATAWEAVKTANGGKVCIDTSTPCGMLSELVLEMATHLGAAGKAFDELIVKDSDLPSVDEAMAYADGYADALKDVKQADISALINEVDSLRTALAIEKGRSSYYQKTIERNKLESEQIDLHIQSAKDARASLHLRDAELSSLRSRVEELSWQPIDCAPDDGTPVLVCWQGETWHPVVMHCEDGKFGVLDDEMGFVAPYKQPTSWMPLPSPPVK